MALKVTYKKPADLTPYENNARTHSKEQVTQIATSIEEFGFTNPILIDGELNVVAGHGRLLAAKQIGMPKVPTITLENLSADQLRAYVIADNKLAELAGWDEDLLRIELSELQGVEFDLSLLGFEPSEVDSIIRSVDDIEGSPYTKKILLPIYEIKGEKPEISDLFDDSKTSVLIDEIRSADIPEEIAEFLIVAADRHTVFNFAKIAEFYAHADASTQDLMEKSALVIIDMNKAIENGFVHMTEHLRDSYDANA